MVKICFCIFIISKYLNLFLQNFENFFSFFQNWNLLFFWLDISSVDFFFYVSLAYWFHSQLLSCDFWELKPPQKCEKNRNKNLIPTSETFFILFQPHHPNNNPISSASLLSLSLLLLPQKYTFKLILIRLETFKINLFWN